jgi:hypothetical protein
LYYLISVFSHKVCISGIQIALRIGNDIAVYGRQDIRDNEASRLACTRSSEYGYIIVSSGFYAVHIKQLAVGKNAIFMAMRCKEIIFI